MIEVGVAKPIAQGQAIINTATALTRAKVSAGVGPKINQTRKVSAAAAMTAGTNHIVTLSTTAWIGSLEPWACSTRLMIRSEEHTSELQSLMRISYAVFCLTKKTREHSNTITHKSRHTE